MGQPECRTYHEIIGAGLPKLHYEAGLTFTCKSDGFLREEKLQPRSETFILPIPRGLYICWPKSLVFSQPVLFSVQIHIIPQCDNYGKVEVPLSCTFLKFYIHLLMY